jgi:hypothetical protein
MAADDRFFGEHDARLNGDASASSYSSTNSVLADERPSGWREHLLRVPHSAAVRVGSRTGGKTYGNNEDDEVEDRPSRSCIRCDPPQPWQAGPCRSWHAQPDPGRAEPPRHRAFWFAGGRKEPGAAAFGDDATKECASGASRIGGARHRSIRIWDGRRVSGA